MLFVVRIPRRSLRYLASVGQHGSILDSAMTTTDLSRLTCGDELQAK